MSRGAIVRGAIVSGGDCSGGDCPGAIVRGANVRGANVLDPNAKPVYGEYKNPLLNVAPLWRLFKMGELTEVMRQKGDSVFIDLLNKVRTGNVDCNDEALLQ